MGGFHLSLGGLPRRGKWRWIQLTAPDRRSPRGKLHHDVDKAALPCDSTTKFETQDDFRSIRGVGGRSGARLWVLRDQEDDGQRGSSEGRRGKKWHGGARALRSAAVFPAANTQRSAGQTEKTYRSSSGATSISLVNRAIDLDANCSRLIPSTEAKELGRRLTINVGPQERRRTAI